MRIPLPPLPEQQRIAALLNKADRLRRLRRYALEMSEGYLQAVFVQMFGDPVTNPMGWDLRVLEEILEIQPHIGTPVPAGDMGEQLCVRVGEIGNSYVDLSRCKYVTLSGADLTRFTLEPGDIVLARAIGSEDHLGKLSILGDSKLPVVFDSHVMRLRTNSKLLLNSYLAEWLRTDGGRACFMRQARRTAVQFNINSEQISALEITLPSTTLQHEFAQFVHKHERLRNQQREALRQAEHLFQTLLVRAFGDMTGTLFA